MKKILIIMMLSIFVFGSAKVDDLTLEYDEAMRFYKAKSFESSYEILSKLYLTKLSDSKLNFYLGRSAFETGHYEVALAAFERVDMLDSGNLRNRLEMGRTYFMLKMYEDAELAFEEVLENPNIPQNVRTNIELYLSKVTKVQQKSFTYINASIDLLYDSNVNYGSLDSEYNINIGTLPAEDVQSDMAAQLYVDLVNIYDIGDKNGFAIKNRVDLYLKEYFDLSDYSVQYLSYNPSVLYKNTKFLGELVAGIDILKLGSLKYLSTLSLTPRVEYSHTNTLRSMGHIKYQKKDFSREEQLGLDANHYELAYSLQGILSPRSYIQVNIKGITERKKDGERVDVDYDEYRLSAIYANQFTAIYGSEFFAEYRKRDYKDYSELFSSIRGDNGGTVAATLNAKVMKYMRLHLKGYYSRVNSNQTRYSYDKYTLTAGLNIIY